MSQTSVDINNPLLKIYAYYRVGLSCLLLMMFSSRLTPNILGNHWPELFFYCSLAYATTNILTLVVLWRRNFSPTAEQIFVILFIDIVALVLLMHASGGLGSGLGFLLLVATATGGIFLNTQASSALAALATLLVLTQALYMMQQADVDSRALFAAGTLGIILFACSLIFNYLSTKLRQSAAEAASKAEQAAHLQQLAQMIVERMQTGIVVATPNGQVQLINRSATELLDWQPHGDRLHLSDIPELEQQVKLWQSRPHTRAPNLKVTDNSQEVRLRFADLADSHPNSTASETQPTPDTLVFVEDTRSLNREAQSLKLASLGRLTASIAHEIRNPLGAISHAGQLLAESTSLDAADRRLTEIIDTNVSRVNQIIENVLQLSRRRPTKPEQVHLSGWLQQFEQDYQDNLSQPVTIELDIRTPEAYTRIDTSHLSQVLTNLVDNGLRHSELTRGVARVSLRLDINPITELPYLLVIDDGDGIPEDSLPHVFEPFFTTQASGSGLGLYLSKELCEANHATLTYCRTDGNKSCFRIEFPHPDRIF